MHVLRPSSIVVIVQVRDEGAGAELQVRSSTNPRQATAADEARMQQILSNPDIREILLDPRIQKLIETLRTDPDKAQRCVPQCQCVRTCVCVQLVRQRHVIFCTYMYNEYERFFFRLLPGRFKFVTLT